MDSMPLEDLGARLFAGTQNIFATMLQMELTREHIAWNEAPPLSAEVTAVIGLAGALQGSLFVHCSLEQARVFTARLLGSEPEEIGDDTTAVLDAIGEIANMAAGNLKRSFPEPAPFELSVPTVIMPMKECVHVKAARTVLVQVAGPCGAFHLEVLLEERPGH